MRPKCTAAYRDLGKVDNGIAALKAILKLLYNVGVDGAGVELQLTRNEFLRGRRRVVIVIRSSGDEVQAEVTAISLRRSEQQGRKGDRYDCEEQPA